MIRTLIAAALATSAFATAASAQNSSTAPPNDAAIAAALNKDSITVGVGVGYVPDYEGSNNYRVVPVPAAIGSVAGHSFEFTGTRGSVDLIPHKASKGITFEAGPTFNVNLNRNSQSGIKDFRVKALPKVGVAVELGAYAGIGKTGVITSDYDRLSLSVSYRHDVSGVNKSGIFSPTLTYLTPLSRQAAVTAFVSAEYTGDRYAQTYFGVTPAGSLASGLPAFNARGGWKNYTIGGLATHSLTGDLLHGFKLVAGGAYSRELGDFAYSPLVRIAGSKNQFIGAVGIAYTF